MIWERYLPDDAATRRLGSTIAGLAKAGDVIALRGGLGAGKTTLARGFLQAVCGAETEAPSPTYTLVQAYDGPGFPIWHFDLYRIEHPGELIELGWDETPAGVALVEWPERAGARLPQWRLDLTLKPYGVGRRAVLEGIGEDWQRRLHDLGI